MKDKFATKTNMIIWFHDHQTTWFNIDSSNIYVLHNMYASTFSLFLLFASSSLNTFLKKSDKKFAQNSILNTNSLVFIEEKINHQHLDNHFSCLMRCGAWTPHLNGNLHMFQTYHFVILSHIRKLHHFAASWLKAEPSLHLHLQFHKNIHLRVMVVILVDLQQN